MRRPRLRTMLLVPLLASLAIGAATLGVFVHRSVERDQLETIDDELTRALLVAVDQDQVAGDGRFPGGARPDSPPRVADEQADIPQEVVLDESGAVVEGDARSEDLASRDLSGLAGSATFTTVDGTPRLRAASVPRTDGTTVVVALSLADVDESLSSLRRNLVVGTVVLIAVQAAIAGLVVAAVNRPVTRLSRTAHRIAEGDLDAEPGPPAGPRETAMLTEDLTTMVDRLRVTIAERERAAARAEQARHDMERFMADASHELRTPLTAVKGFSDLYDAGMLDDDGVDRAMERIGTESERLTDLVNDLLRLLRPTDAQSQEPVDMAAVASAVVHDLRAAYTAHPLDLALDGSESFVLGDPARLHQAVLNLGANACQHTPAGTPVTIGVSARDGTATVSIVDRGPGIDPDLADEIFEPFVRADRSRSRRSHDGAGLGLTITRRITEQHGGSVHVSPTPGGGTTVELALPAIDPATATANG